MVDKDEVAEKVGIAHPTRTGETAILRMVIYEPEIESSSLDAAAGNAGESSGVVDVRRDMRADGRHVTCAGNRCG